MRKQNTPLTKAQEDEVRKFDEEPVLTLTEKFFLSIAVVVGLAIMFMYLSNWPR